MAEESSNRQVALKHLRRGLAIYKTGRSPFWHARLYDPAKKRYVVRSTKETTRLDAAEVAKDYVAGNREHVCPLVRRYRIDRMIVAQRATNLHHQCSSEDKLSWRIAAGCSGTCGAFVVGSHAAVHRRRWGSASEGGGVDLDKAFCARK